MAGLRVTRIAAAAGAAVASCSGGPGSEPEPFESSWASLAAHEAAPEWFRDAERGLDGPVVTTPAVPADSSAVVYRIHLRPGRTVRVEP